MLEHFRGLRASSQTARIRALDEQGGVQVQIRYRMVDVFSPRNKAAAVMVLTSILQAGFGKLMLSPQLSA